MNRNDFEILDSEVCYQGFYRLERLRLRHRLFAGGMSPAIVREVIEKSDVAAVLLYDPQRDEVVMIEQYLDKASQAQLARGQRIVEILKQDQYRPIPVAKQVALIFAATNGVLDDLPVESLRRFETEFFAWLDGVGAGVQKALADKKDVDDTLRAQLTEALATFKAGFKP
jgi:F0F1-type ATP synthase alpha subunit